MASLNKVMLIGNLTRDPELKYIQSGTALCKFGMAINRTWAHEGEKKTEVCFVDCVAWGKAAELLNQYMVKGRPLFIEGRLTFSQWETEDNKKRSKLEVTIERFQFLGVKPQDKMAAGAPEGSEDNVTSDDIKL